MAEELQDLADMLSPDDFGTAADFGGTTVNGIFVRSNEDALTVEGVHPTLLVRDHDVASVPIDVDDTCTISSTTYKVVAIEPEGTNSFTLLVLEDQTP